MHEYDDSDDRTERFTLLTRGLAIGHYRIVSPIGAGGMGEVYLAEDTALDRPVAMKFLPRALSRTEEYRRRFLREAQAAARLSHPNIVTIFEVGDHDGRPYFTMEHVEGRSLKDYAAELHPSLETIIDLIDQLAEGLASAHEKGVTHRDIKPANILIDSHGRARIVDFGLASVKGTDHITRTGSTLGTIGYMSPEQVTGGEVDSRSDLFSLGVVFYELLTGRSPFRADSEAATLYAIANKPPEPLSRYRSDTPSGLQAIVDRLLAKDPAQRYQAAGELTADLARFRTSPSGFPETIERAASIAVLPFTNLSADPEQEYFCDGIAEDIIGDLNQIPGLRVVARTSAFAFKGKHEDVREIGRRLNVAHVLEGSVRKAGGRLRISAQLIEVSSGYQVWADKYDRQLEDLFAIQDEISHAIVEQLKLELGDEPARPRNAAEPPIEAYQLYSQGRHQLNLRTAESFAQALEYFEQCIRLAPDYPLVHAGLADAYFLLFAYDIMTPRDASARSRIAAQRAIELDCKVADPYATLGGVLTFHDWAWADAEQSFRKALELTPGHATSHQWYGELLTFLGRSEESARHFEIALQHDPLSPVVLTMYGWHHLRFGRPAEALTHVERAIELHSSNDFTYVLAGQAHIALGDARRGYEYLQQAREVSHDSVLSLSTWGHMHALDGKPEVTTEALARLLDACGDQYIPQAYLAALHHDVGHHEEALACLKEALRRRDAELIFMAVMPSYAPVRRDPQLATLLSVLGLPPTDR